jgi:hypothetical protein
VDSSVGTATSYWVEGSVIAFQLLAQTLRTTQHFIQYAMEVFTWGKAAGVGSKTLASI